MPLTFYPSSDHSPFDPLQERIGMLMEAAENFKAAILDNAGKPLTKDGNPMAPKDQRWAFNWENLAIVLREIREKPEGNEEDREKKSAFLAELAEVYEVLRAARMSKLEAVRLALVTESNQLKGDSEGGTGQVA